MRVAVVSLRDRLEALLAGSVPYLKLDRSEAIHRESLDLEVHTDGTQILLNESVLREPQQHRRFASA